MGINYINLDEITRKDMIGELEYDLQSETLYYSDRLNQHGIDVWVSLLRQSIEHNNDDWLSVQLQTQNCLKSHETRNRAGKSYVVKVPYTASATLAEGEFNRMYARGLCVRAIRQQITDVEIYRGKAVMHPRSESEFLIGKRFSATELLNDLRNSKGVEPALGVPPGPNSGITIKLPN
jgi:hypothetical protein